MIIKLAAAINHLYSGWWEARQLLYYINVIPVLLYMSHLLISIWRLYFGTCPHTYTHTKTRIVFQQAMNPCLFLQPDTFPFTINNSLIKHHLICAVCVFGLWFYILVRLKCCDLVGIFDLSPMRKGWVVYFTAFDPSSENNKCTTLERWREGWRERERII